MEISDKKRVIVPRDWINLITSLSWLRVSCRVNILPYGYETTEQKLEDKCSVTEAVKLDSM